LLTAQKFQKELLDQSRRDFLTKALNRRAFEGIVAGEWSRALRHDHPTSFLMVDIDHFKKVNDQYGHSAGDNVLVDVLSVADDMSGLGSARSVR
jgi:two-component system chemotaxis family response regulator WspR